MCLSVLVGGGFVCCFVLWDFFVRFFYKLKCKEAAPASGSRIPRCICFDIKVRFFFFQEGSPMKPLRGERARYYSKAKVLRPLSLILFLQKEDVALGNLLQSSSQGEGGGRSLHL